MDDVGAEYPITVDPIIIVEKAKLTASDGAAWDYFGNSVSISGNTIVVGVPGDDGKGAAYVFDRDQGGPDNWGEVKKLTASDGASGDSFGHTVSINGDTVVVGAFGDNIASNTDQGSAYVFERNQGGSDNWGEIKKLTASDGEAWDFFGWSVSISSDTIVVGAQYDDAPNNMQGSAYVFMRNEGGANNWGEIKKLTASDGAANDYFGYSVSIHADTIVVGAFADIVVGIVGQGSAYVFERNHGGSDNWGQVKQLTASDGANSDYFGWSVSIDVDTIVVGSYMDDVDVNTDQGSAYVFERNHGGSDNWGEMKQIVSSDGEADDWFGHSVSIQGDTIVVGPKYDDIDGKVNQGSAYVFMRNEGGPDTWGEFDRITASDGEEAEYFGFSVSNEANIIVVGAQQDNISGKNGQGSAYVFYLENANVPPNIITTDDPQAYEDTPYNVDYDANDPDPDILTWSISYTETDGWLTIDPNSGLLSGTPDNSDVGSWRVNVTVDDGNGSIDWSNFTLNVENTDPTIITSDNATAFVDTPYSVDYDSDDDGQGTITWIRWTDADFLNIDVVTGILSGTPDNTDIGDWTVNVTVNDGNGGSDSRNFTLNVSGVAPTVPSVPQSLQTAVGNRYVLLSWEIPSENGGSEIIGYKIYRNGTVGPYGTVPADQLWFNDTEVINGLTYTYNVSAYNVIGEGSKPSTSATPKTIPSPPKNIHVNEGNGYANLTWNNPLSNGGSEITGFYIYRNGTLIDTIDADQLWYNDTNVLNGVTYTYNVSAYNDVGEGPKPSTIGTPKTIPSEPQNLEASLGSGYMNLTWDVPSFDGGSEIINYRIYRGEIQGEEEFLAEIGNLTFYNDTSVINGVTYYYKVKAKNGVGEGQLSDGVLGTPNKIPTAPEDLQATAGIDFIYLIWDAPSDNGGSLITNYKIYKGTSSDGETFLEEVGNVLFYNDTDVTKGVTYYYKVSAKNVIGEGLLSSEVNATPVPSNQLPTCTLYYPQSGSSITGTIEVYGIASDGDSTVQRVEIKIDDGDWIWATGTTSWSYDLDTTELTNGQHTIYIRSYDGTNHSSEMSINVDVNNLETEEQEDMFLLGMLILLIIVVAVIIALLVLKKRKPMEEEEDGDEFQEEVLLPPPKKAKVTELYEDEVLPEDDIDKLDLPEHDEEL
jgi:fibronectin type 3 domain-containing protein